ncbi:polysaccharide biosynthesis protein [Lucifera butyrica]|uniref:Polysaccharide biosynthesis protein n=1 Tax=Lucifera butyrica TaxID=1351585 RepID=A0A498RCZ0_9FIRM|nr:polysaccharide biosynthesis protein [Lucifera butyrica]
MPLITLPYLLRVLGADKYGMIAFAQALMQYLVVITDYGFNLTVTREISINRNNIQEVATIYNNVLCIKIIVMIICFLLMCLAVFYIPAWRSEWLFYFSAYLIVVGNAIFPLWFFQGMEEMKYITLINILSRLLSVAALFIFVKTEADFVLAMTLQGLGVLIGGVVALYVVYYKYKIFINRLPTKQEIYDLLKNGKEVFISTLSGNVYGQGATLITGILAGSASAGYYSLAQKLSSAVVGLMQPIAQAIYPRCCTIFVNDKKLFLKIRTILMLSGTLFGTICSILIFIFSRQIVLLIGGKIYPELTTMIQIFSFITIFTMLNVLLNSILLATRKYAIVQKMYLAIAILFLITSIPITKFFGSYGMAYCMLGVEIYIFMQSYFHTSSGSIN